MWAHMILYIFMVRYSPLWRSITFHESQQNVRSVENTSYLWRQKSSFFEKKRVFWRFSRPGGRMVDRKWPFFHFSTVFFAFLPLKLYFLHLSENSICYAYLKKVDFLSTSSFLFFHLCIADSTTKTPAHLPRWNPKGKIEIKFSTCLTTFQDRFKPIESKKKVLSNLFQKKNPQK